MEVDETIWTHPSKEQPSEQKTLKSMTRIPSKIPTKSVTSVSKVSGKTASKIPTKLPTKANSTISSNVVYTSSKNTTKNNGAPQPSCNTNSNRWQHQIDHERYNTDQCVFGDLDCNDNTPVMHHDSLNVDQVSACVLTWGGTGIWVTDLWVEFLCVMLLLY